MKIKERGIIFNSEMVRAILDGRKTQARRVIKNCMVGRDEISPFIKVGNFSGHYPDDLPEVIKNCCPFGQVGDRLWVKETWSDVNYEGYTALAYRADGELRALNEDDGDDSDPNLEKYQFANWYPDLIEGTGGRWRSSMQMPRWASRITLEITDIRVERLQDISQEDARSEGITDGGCINCGEPEPCVCEKPTPDAVDSYAYLWNNIYGQDSWQSNPWVWVIEFKRIEK